MLAVLLLCVLPQPDVAPNRVGVVEVLHLYDDREGRHIGDYLIFWHWHPERQSHHVRAWRYYRGGGEFLRTAAGWKVLWSDDGLLRQVEAVSVRERWEQYDTEIADRDVYPADQRENLRPRR